MPPRPLGTRTDRNFEGDSNDDFDSAYDDQSRFPGSSAAAQDNGDDHTQVAQEGA